MQDRIETAIVYVTWFATIVSYVIGALLVPPLLYVGAVGLLLMWGYSIYWALNLRRHLSAQVYRNQALGAGLIAFGWASYNVLNFIASGVSGQGSGGDVGFVSALAFFFSLLLTFYWIDSSALAARKSDPLYRNSFHWREVRLAMWPIVAGATIALVLIALADPSLLFPSSGNATLLFSALILTAIFGVFGAGLLVLPVVGRRSRDQVLRRNLEWFGLFAASFALFFVLIVLSSGTTNFILSSMTYVVGSYCVYRGTRSLAPINRLPDFPRAPDPVPSS